MTRESDRASPLAPRRPAPTIRQLDREVNGSAEGRQCQSPGTHRGRALQRNRTAHTHCTVTVAFQYAHGRSLPTFTRVHVNHEKYQQYGYFRLFIFAITTACQCTSRPIPRERLKLIILGHYTINITHNTLLL